jgi:phosphoribosylglycinamide formyltransferase-1
MWSDRPVKKIGLITYDSRHLKTEQVALGLAQRQAGALHFFALPFVSRAPRPILFPHRPDMATGAHSRTVAETLGMAYDVCATPSEIPSDGCDLFLILGAGLLPPEFVRATEGRVLNGHPGLIPAVRGLDAFKWAIFDGMEVGNTLHFIDEEADAGELVATAATPVFKSDTLASFARRHYELEIMLMLDFSAHLALPPSVRPEPDQASARPARRRMPAAEEKQLWERFELYKERFARA